MSSFVGHGLVAAATFGPPRPAGSGRRRISKLEPCWLAWLIMVGWAPDLDYVIPVLDSERWDGLRITHSVIGALCLPALTAVAIMLLSADHPALRVVQVSAAGMSHIVLDFFVGVHPLPFFWPLSDVEFRMSPGILPSAGAIQLTNFYFWRNVLIELAIIVPLLFTVRFRSHQKRRRILPALLAVATIALGVSISLDRVIG